MSLLKKIFGGGKSDHRNEIASKFEKFGISDIEYSTVQKANMFAVLCSVATGGTPTSQSILKFYRDKANSPEVSAFADIALFIGIKRHLSSLHLIDKVNYFTILGNLNASQKENLSKLIIIMNIMSSKNEGITTIAEFVCEKIGISAIEFQKNEQSIISLLTGQSQNSLIKKLGGYNITYSKEQKIAIFLSVMAASTFNKDIKLSLEETYIFDSISEYLDTKELGSDDSTTEFLSKGQDNITFTLNNLNNEQKDFYIVILNLVTSLGGNIEKKTNYAYGICAKIGVNIDKFNNTLKEINKIIKRTNIESSSNNKEASINESHKHQTPKQTLHDESPKYDENHPRWK